jgi:hypothetical protein
VPPPSVFAGAGGLVVLACPANASTGHVIGHGALMLEPEGNLASLPGGDPMSAELLLAAAETKLLKAKRTYARKALGLLAAHLHRDYPQAVRLSVYVDRRAGEYFIGELLDARGEPLGFDASGLVVPGVQVEGPFREEITVGPYDVAELLHHALATYDGPLEKVLRAERYPAERYLDLRHDP